MAGATSSQVAGPSPGQRGLLCSFPPELLICLPSSGSLGARARLARDWVAPMCDTHSLPHVRGAGQADGIQFLRPRSELRPHTRSLDNSFNFFMSFNKYLLLAETQTPG